MTIGMEPERRLTAVERREQILHAAAEVFGARGYTATTTDQVARAAGISQPYVVRMFGTKETLFLEVLERSRVALLEAFRAEIARHRDAGGPEDLLDSLGDTYIDLIRDRGIHLPLMQAFLQGADPVIGAKARQGFLDIHHLLLTEAGCSVEEARDFLAQGMLVNVLLGLRMPVIADADPEAAALLEATCGSRLPFLAEDLA